MSRPRPALCAVGAAIGAGALLAAEGWLAARSRAADCDDPPPGPLTYGEEGRALRYVVLGDSTAAGRGCEYGRGIAGLTAERLAVAGRVRLINLGRSGARARDVLRDQVPRAVRLTPDLALVSVGANDAIRLTRLRRLRRELDTLLARLAEGPSAPAVVLVSAPEIGAVRRFRQPLRGVLGRRARRVSSVIERAAGNAGARYAPLDRLVGGRFHREPELFAGDEIHPSARGYAVLADALAPVLAAASEGRAGR